MKTGIELIEAERQHHIDLGFTLLSDQNYTNEELVKLAVFLLTMDERHFPENMDRGMIAKAQNRSDFENQIIAGALIAANLDRINGKSKSFE